VHVQSVKGAGLVTNEWDAVYYDSKLDFVSDLGRSLVALLQPKPGEYILDLGCGTGELAYDIASYGAYVMGIDSSETMIQHARTKYPNLSFVIANGERFTVTRPYDAVFSNAALHWMTAPEPVIHRVWEALAPGGRFVAEFGGKGNVQTVIRSLEQALAELGVASSERNPWYFPSIADYTTLLEKQGFWATLAVHFDRPTKMPDGEMGLQHWLTGFAHRYFEGLDDSRRNWVLQRTADLARESLYQDGQWVIDYQRLRIAAVKI
jgi:trans-aconitate methyltransferase